MAKKRKHIDIDTASRDELIAYIKRIEARSEQMKANYKASNKYAGRINEAICRLATEGSLAFQAMAEKAGVRGHPSVTRAVKLFDSLVGLQWGLDEVPKIEWPEDWDFDGKDEQWAGDADMHLNSPIAELIEMFQHTRFNVSPEAGAAIRKAIDRAEKAMREHIDGIKANHGFRTKTVSLANPPHGVGWALLDLAQDMAFANEMLRRDLRASVYRRVCSDLYALSNCEFGDGPGKIDIKVLGAEEPF